MITYDAYDTNVSNVTVMKFANDVIYFKMLS